MTQLFPTREDMPEIASLFYSTVKRWAKRYADFPRVYVGLHNGRAQAVNPPSFRKPRPNSDQRSADFRASFRAIPLIP